MRAPQAYEGLQGNPRRAPEEPPKSPLEAPAHKATDASHPRARSYDERSPAQRLTTNTLPPNDNDDEKANDDD